MEAAAQATRASGDQRARDALIGVRVTDRRTARGRTIRCRSTFAGGLGARVVVPRFSDVKIHLPFLKLKPNTPAADIVCFCQPLVVLPDQYSIVTG